MGEGHRRPQRPVKQPPQWHRRRCRHRCRRLWGRAAVCVEIFGGGWVRCRCQGGERGTAVGGTRPLGGRAAHRGILGRRRAAAEASLRGCAPAAGLAARGLGIVVEQLDAVHLRRGGRQPAKRQRRGQRGRAAARGRSVLRPSVGRRRRRRRRRWLSAARLRPGLRAPAPRRQAGQRRRRRRRAGRPEAAAEVGDAADHDQVRADVGLIPRSGQRWWVPRHGQRRHRGGGGGGGAARRGNASAIHQEEAGQAAHRRGAQVHL
mmetsp:Transcript_73469/g.185245  ORF Transcript_73469/g.185245 Transcript_73469/m.185245 type:complete len:262 (+) Transcript_73469:340-1125(+)